MRKIIFEYECSLEELELVLDIEEYLEENYEENVDYILTFGRGDDVCNCMEVSDEILSDERFIELLREIEFFEEEN